MTVSTSPPVPAAIRMGRRLTTPFGRGADTLPLRLSLSDSSQASVEPYDFADHTARFGVRPEARYVLAAARDIDADTTVTVSFEDPAAGPAETRVEVPAGTVAGTSFLIEGPVSATARVVLLTMGTSPADNAPQDWWTLTALLGTTAKLLWVLGVERDQLARHAARTLAQRHLPTAVGLSLDLIGADLGVPRFPPLPYGFDPSTAALYHLDDAVGDIPAVADLTDAYPGRTGHPGVLVGAVQRGRPGRYGRAMGFPAAGTAVEVPTDTEFDILETGGATMECFVRPSGDSTSAPEDGPVLSRHAAPGGDGPGWMLAIGDFGRGLDRNVRFSISDGRTVVDLFADLSLPTDTFSHLAAVLDPSGGGRVFLYVDGVRRDWRFTFPLGAVVNTAPLRIGAGDVPGFRGFRGVVDEVRISSVARTGFGPALGEDDDHYRRRLELFRRWTLPTPANLEILLNQLAGPIGGRTDALIVDDTNATLVRGTRLVQVRPVALLPGQSIDAAGRRNVTEASVVGTAEAEDTFDPGYLFRYDRPDVVFTPPPSRRLGPGERAPDPHLVQVAVAERLDRLITLAGAESDTPGRLLIDSGYDPRADDLRATGRAVQLGHDSVAPGRLAALAHRVGFDHVTYRPGGAAAQVYAAVAPADYFTLDLTPAGAGPTDVDAGASAELSLRPVPPPGAALHWLIVPGGVGRATLVPGNGTASASLRATAPGEVIVRVDVTRGRHTVSATRVVRVGLADLPAGGTIAADGTLGADPATLDRPEVFFHPAFLLVHGDPRVDYGTDDAHRMQPSVGELLDRMLTELTRRAVPGRLTVVAAFDSAAFDAGAVDAAAQGRRLVLRHSTLTPEALARVAFAVGFGHLTHADDTLEVRQPPGQLVAVTGPAGVDHDAVIELDEGHATDLTVSPSPAVLAAAGLTGRAPGEGPQLSWASGAFDDAAVTLGSNTELTVTLQAGAAGAAWVQASYLIGAEPAPYTFQVRLRPELDTPQTVISKDQHDLIMNVLNTLHPVGVEVGTVAIRAHVIELQGDLAQANPDYTYPKFRVRGPLPRPVRGSTRG